MKRLLITGCIFLLMMFAIHAVAQEKVKTKDDKVKVKDENGKMKMKSDNGMMNDYPYTANYSSNFSIGNAANAKLVLAEWKDWDDNMLDRHDFMADTIVTFMPDGTVTKGKDANMAMWKKFRNSLTSSKSTVDAWVPLRSTDRNEDWVAVWGTETNTYPDGKVDKHDIHELWRINKDGKVDYYQHYSSVASPQ